MREMKDSGVEWIKELPVSWGMKKLKYLTIKCERGTSPEYVEDDITAVVNQATFSKGFFDTSNIRFSSKPAETSKGLLKKKDVLLASTGGGVLGKVYYFYEDKTYVADGHVTIIRTSSGLNAKFLYYYFYINFETFNSQMAKGSTNQIELQRDLLLEMIVPLPDITEQWRIVDFLDIKCAEADSLTTDIQAQIDTLEQYKRSVITEAVTKGLSPYAPMSTGRLTWVKQIPTHWQIIPAKALFGECEKRRCDGDQQLTASQKYGIITQKDYMERANANIVLATQGLENWKHVDPYDFIISLRSFQGGLEMSQITGCISWHYVVLKAKKPICPRYYKWLFKSSQYINALQGTCNFIRDGQDLRFSNFIQVPLFEPPMNEQEQIADYLDKKCAEIDEIIERKREQLATIEEYKKSLIFEYVTGKKEVAND